MALPAQVRVPNDRDEIREHHLELHGHEQEVQRLRGRPQLPVRHGDVEPLGAQGVRGLGQPPFERVHEADEHRVEQRREQELVGGHLAQRAAEPGLRERAEEHAEPHVQRGAHQHGAGEREPRAPAPVEGQRRGLRLRRPCRVVVVGAVAFAAADQRALLDAELAQRASPLATMTPAVSALVRSGSTLPSSAFPQLFPCFSPAARRGNLTNHQASNLAFHCSDATGSGHEGAVAPESRR